jgi:hypothetical protein
MSENTCETCKYWDNSAQLAGVEPDTTGACRRRAPLPDERDGSARWAFTEDMDWCGEHQSRKRDS